MSALGHDETKEEVQEIVLEAPACRRTNKGWTFRRSRRTRIGIAGRYAAQTAIRRRDAVGRGRRIEEAYRGRNKGDGTCRSYSEIMRSRRTEPRGVGDYAQPMREPLLAGLVPRGFGAQQGSSPCPDRSVAARREPVALRNQKK